MKKRKSIHIRRIRPTSRNKFYKYDVKKFYSFLNIYFKKKLRKKFSFCSFLLCFIGLNKQRIMVLFKLFGLNKNYLLRRVNINYDIFLNILKKKYNHFKFGDFTRYNDVNNKKKLFLHVSYRHFLRLPVRGQRTKTNAKTRKHYAII